MHCTADGCPVAVEVFESNTSDPVTVASQLAKVRKRFGVTRLALIGDRGMLITAFIRETVKPSNVDWISM